MQISDFDFPGIPTGPPSDREHAREGRLRRAPLLIPHPEPETETAGPAPQIHSNAADLR